MTFSLKSLYPKQLELFTGGGPNVRFRYGECSSGCGKTYGAAILCGHLSCKLPARDPDTNLPTYVGWVAPDYNRCKQGFRAILSQLTLEAIEYLDSKNAITRAVGNMSVNFQPLMAARGRPDLGATVEFRSGGDPDNIYGGIYRLGFGEESSRFSELTRDAFLTTLNKGGIPNKAWFWGNVTDQWNWFYAECRDAEVEMAETPPDERQNHFASLNWRDACEAQMRDQEGNLLWLPDGNPRMVQTPEMIDDMRRKMTDLKFMSDYENIPISEQGRPFTDEMIAKNVVSCTCGANSKKISLCPECEGIFPQTEASYTPFIGALDISRVLDWNFHIKLDRFGRLVYLDRWQDGDYGRIMERVFNNTGGEYLAPDLTGIGEAILPIINSNYDHMWPQILPTKWTKRSAPKLVQNAQRGMQQGEYKFPRGIIAQEFASIQIKKTPTAIKYEAAEGQTDDGFDAMCMGAWWLRYQQGFDMEQLFHFTPYPERFGRVG